MATTGMVDITLKEFVTSVLNQLRNDAGQTNTLGGGPSQNIINFMVAWAHVEGGSQTNACHFNILNTIQDEPGAVQCGGNVMPGIKAYPDAATGEKAQIDALKDGHYPSLLHALQTNDENNLGFNHHAMARNIAGDLTFWKSGKRSPLAQSYILTIMQCAGIDGAYFTGGTSNGGPASPQSQIDSWGAQVIGQGTTDGTSVSTVNAPMLVKIGGGVLMLLAGVALLIKNLSPSIKVG